MNIIKGILAVGAFWGIAAVLLLNPMRFFEMFFLILMVVLVVGISVMIFIAGTNL